MKTWGHRIDPIGQTARAWLHCSKRCTYLHRFVIQRGRITATRSRPLTTPAAKKLAAKLGLALPAPSPDPFVAPKSANNA